MTRKFRAWNGTGMLYSDTMADTKENIGLLTRFFALIDGTQDDKKEILSQYIGLCDINGKEIYEGDIVSIQEQGRYQTYIVPQLNVLIADPGFEHLFEATIVGNIYENPELAKEAIT